MKHFTLRNILLCLAGTLTYCLAFNMVIVPAGLYASGFVGISQLITDQLERFVHVRFHLQSVVYFCVDVPLFLAGFRILGKKNILFTMLIVAMESVFMALIPIPKKMILDDTFAVAICGGCLEGIGTSITFRGFGSSGGTDLLGLMLTEKNRKLSVGKVNFIVNAAVYTYAAFCYSFQTAIYSLIAEVFVSLMIDRLHKQNNIVTVNIISDQYDDFCRYIISTLNRGATLLEGKGAYSHAERKVIVAVLSEYELGLLEKEAEKIDKDAFIFASPNTVLSGDFEKRLS